MKNSFFALALLVSAMATANVKLDVTARCGNDTTEQSFDLTNASNSCTIEHSSGVRTFIVLEEEGADAAEFTVKVTTDKGERELANSKVTVPYGKTKSVKCVADAVDAELTLEAKPAAEVRS